MTTNWKQFIIPTNKKKEDVSGKVDAILYNTSFFGEKVRSKTCNFRQAA